ncbi:hypothetical protein DCAR_0205252 [Daucus carota subsp. sativus]|uniref:Uncharacterized protein n=1 Tax=Daucus carota subsp. sativus TaxID=79200 RepID=A0A175YAI7_DAUCS|nr:hypothetical protein DCAR_0205252 [Daucus carota subsp. sativus]
MSRSLDECDAILDNMCDCYRMSVEKTRWYGDAIGRRYRECPEGVCGFHKWVDPPLCTRGQEALRELQRRHEVSYEDDCRRRDALLAWYDRRLEDERKKFTESLAGLSLLCDVVKNLVLEASDPVEPVEPAPSLYPPMEEWE